MKITKNMLLTMGLITLFGMGAIGAVIIETFQDKSWQSVFTHGVSWYMQLIYGLGYGTLAGLLALLLLKQKFMAKTLDFYQQLFSGLELSIGGILFISYCAGVGEEMLFRGALQEFMGIIVTAVIFVAIHGYLNPKNWQLSIYGFYMTLVIIGIGFMFEIFGMISSMSAHFIIDVILLYSLMRANRKTTAST